MVTIKGKDYTAKATLKREQKTDEIFKKINEKRKQNENVKTRPERERNRKSQTTL